jgi:hypothetical protein
MALALYAGIRVHDFTVALRWYERLLGEPSFFAHATEAVWILADERSVYVEEDADGAGHGLVTIFVTTSTRSSTRSPRAASSRPSG